MEPRDVVVGDEETPCPCCDGRGEIARPAHAWFEDRHGFDSLDEWVECLRCDGTGRPS